MGIAVVVRNLFANLWGTLRRFPQDMRHEPRLWMVGFIFVIAETFFSPLTYLKYLIILFWACLVATSYLHLVFKHFPRLDAWWKEQARHGDPDLGVYIFSQVFRLCAFGYLLGWLSVELVSYLWSVFF